MYCRQCKSENFCKTLSLKLHLTSLSVYTCVYVCIPAYAYIGNFYNGRFLYGFFKVIRYYIFYDPSPTLIWHPPSHLTNTSCSIIPFLPSYTYVIFLSFEITPTWPLLVLNLKTHNNTNLAIVYWKKNVKRVFWGVRYFTQSNYFQYLSNFCISSFH